MPLRSLSACEFTALRFEGGVDGYLRATGRTNGFLGSRIMYNHTKHRIRIERLLVIHENLDDPSSNQLPARSSDMRIRQPHTIYQSRSISRCAPHPSPFLRITHTPSSRPLPVDSACCGGGDGGEVLRVLFSLLLGLVFCSSFVGCVMHQAGPV